MLDPADAKKLLVVKNLPQLISVTQGIPAQFSFRSTQKTPLLYRQPTLPLDWRYGLPFRRVMFWPPKGLKTGRKESGCRTGIPVSPWPVMSLSRRLSRDSETRIPCRQELAQHEILVRKATRRMPEVYPLVPLIDIIDRQTSP